MQTPESALFRLDDESNKDSKPNPVPVLEQHLLESRTLIVSGPISDKLATRCAERLFVMESQDKDAPITVLINSPGGSADSGFAIYDMLRFVAPPIRTIVNGLCASAGILVHLAGDPGKRHTTPESRFMIHQPSTMGQGTASDLDITAQQVIKLRERYVRIIADACKQTVERVLENARRDFWLDADEALAYNLVDSIVARRSDLD